MVTKKTVVGSLDTHPTQSTNPPYPVSPNDQADQQQQEPASASSVYSTDLNDSSAFDLIDINEARTKKRRDSDVSSHGTWDTDRDEDEKDDEEARPKPLDITPKKQVIPSTSAQQTADLPSILKPGPIATTIKKQDDLIAPGEPLANPWANEVTRKPLPQSNNPYLKTKTPVTENSAPDWDSLVPPSPSAPPPPPPPPSMPPFPSHSTSHQTGESSSKVAPTNLTLPPSEIPQFQPPVELPSHRTPTHELQNLSLNNNDAKPNTVPQSNHTDSKRPPYPIQPVENSAQPTAQQKWGDDEDLYSAPSALPSRLTEPSSSFQDDSQSDLLLNHESPKPPQTNKVGSLPPPISTQPPPPLHTRSTDSVPETPTTKARRQRSEHYQIKQINWRDAAIQDIRRSPILTQNANGPCPLLALVNALVLTTPAGADTALVETLRSREQVSLGLLLDAVFDELMSGRRGDAATELPDVTELYSFLLALHTGMNVNPRFIPPPANGVVTPAGSFEHTKEMRLYSTFNLPLLHGWLPQSNSRAYSAFDRCAQSFEDAQNVQFNESELEEKLRAVGLSATETQSLEDIQTIKEFLLLWPTQLTDYGLESISNGLKPGQFAILFRNDHFSTIYKEPTHGALMTLVTDAGYSSHEEIVWESLVDVNGAASEMFSGDFRTVSHDHDVQASQNETSSNDWQSVQSRSRYHNQPNRQRSSTSNTEARPPLPGPRPINFANSTLQTENLGSSHQRSQSEQEDHDLALALQLQEEEEAQQQRANDQRRREQELTEQFLSNSGQNEGRPPTIPPRRGGSRQSTSTRPAVSRPAQDDPDAPPTYEQSASDRPYRENGSGATPSQGHPLNTYDALRRQQEEQQSAYAQQSGSPINGSSPFANGQRPGNNRLRRTSTQTGMPGAYSQTTSGRRPGQMATAQDADERCSVM